jgi:transposase
LLRHRLSLAAQGRSLLLSQGWHQSNHWWKPMHWETLQTQLPAWLIEALEVFRRLIGALNQELPPLTQAVEASAPAMRPKGLGALTFSEIQREVCDWSRFKNRKAVGSYAGLVGGVSASGDYHCDLAITKAGNVRLRTLLIEAAWRWVVYQSQCPLIQRWSRILLNPRAHKRARKRAIVAVARCLLVDLWRWQTKRKAAQELGWVMVAAPVASH